MVSETFFCGTCCNCFLINIVYLHLQISIVRNMEFQIREGEDYIQLIQLLKVVGIACNGPEEIQESWGIGRPDHSVFGIHDDDCTICWEGMLFPSDRLCDIRLAYAIQHRFAEGAVILLWKGQRGDHAREPSHRLVCDAIGHDANLRHAP